MDLIKLSREHLAWLWEAIMAFMRAEPIATAFVVGATAVSRFAKLLAFFVPLKVIILVGSAGVPRYFPFIDPEAKTEWMIAFSVAAAAFYVIAEILDHYAEQFAQRGSATLLRRSAEITVVENQQKKAQSYFNRVCGTWAALLFSVFAAAAIALLYLPLAGFILVLLAAQLWLTAVVLRGHEPGTLHGRAAYIEQNFSEYVNVLSAGNFILVFGFLLVGFLVLGLENLIVAVLCILLARQLFTNLTEVVVGGVRMALEREAINALIFEAQTFARKEAVPVKRFRRLFARSEREARASDIVSDVLGLQCEQTVVDWVDDEDSVSRTFKWNAVTASGKNIQWIERVFGPERRSFADHEWYLHDCVGASGLKAPPMIHAYMVEEFTCHLYEIVCGERATIKWFQDNWPEVLGYYWSLEPPRRLLDAFRRAKPTLAERFTEELVERLSVGINSAHEERLLSELLDGLPEAREYINRMPLFICNLWLSSPGFRPTNVLIVDEGRDFRVLRWHCWTLEPVGVGMETARLEIADLDPILRPARARSDWPHDINEQAVVCLVSAAHQLERLIEAEKYQVAFGMVPRVIGFAEQAATGRNENVVSLKEAGAG